MRIYLLFLHCVVAFVGVAVGVFMSTRAGLVHRVNECSYLLDTACGAAGRLVEHARREVLLLLQ